MKIICLNVWGGRRHEALLNFLERCQDIDVFCFQEVYRDAVGKDTIWFDAHLNLLKDLVGVLPDYELFFHPQLRDWWGLATFVKKTLRISDAGEHFVHTFQGDDPELEKVGYMSRNIQFVTLEKDEKPFTVLNFHGLWNGVGKLDSEDRIEQSKKIISFIQNIQHDYVLCGDFNLLPTTKSIHMIERELGVRNLITEFGITSTRTSLYIKPEKFADYMFVPKHMPITSFEVLQDEVSDHCALYLEIP